MSHIQSVSQLQTNIHRRYVLLETLADLRFTLQTEYAPITQVRILNSIYSMLCQLLIVITSRSDHSRY